MQTGKKKDSLTSEIVIVALVIALAAISLMGTFYLVPIMRRELRISVVWYPVSLIPFILSVDILVVSLLSKRLGRGFVMALNAQTVLIIAMSLATIVYAMYLRFAVFALPTLALAEVLFVNIVGILGAVFIHRRYLSSMK